MNTFLEGYMHKYSNKYTDKLPTYDEASGYRDQLLNYLPALEVAVNYLPIEEENKENLREGLNTVERTGRGWTRVEQGLNSLPEDTRNELFETVRNMDLEQAKELKKKYGNNLGDAVAGALSVVKFKDPTGLPEPGDGIFDFAKRVWQASGNKDEKSDKGNKESIMKNMFKQYYESGDAGNLNNSNPYKVYTDARNMLQLVNAGVSPGKLTEKLIERHNLTEDEAKRVLANMGTVNNMAASATGGALAMVKPQMKETAKKHALKKSLNIAINKARKLGIKKPVQWLSSRGASTLSKVPGVALGFDAWEANTGDWNKRMQEYKDWADFRNSPAYENLSSGEKVMFNAGKAGRNTLNAISDIAVSVEMLTGPMAGLDRPPIEELPVKQNLDAWKDLYTQTGHVLYDKPIQVAKDVWDKAISKKFEDQSTLFPVQEYRKKLQRLLK